MFSLNPVLVDCPTPNNWKHHKTLTEAEGKERGSDVTFLRSFSVRLEVIPKKGDKQGKLRNKEGGTVSVDMLVSRLSVLIKMGEFFPLFFFFFFCIRINPHWEGFASSFSGLRSFARADNAKKRKTSLSDPKH